MSLVIDLIDLVAKHKSGELRCPATALISSILCLVYNEVLTFDMHIHVRVPSHPYMWILEGTQHAV